MKSALSHKHRLGEKFSSDYLRVLERTLKWQIVLKQWLEREVKMAIK